VLTPARYPGPMHFQVAELAQDGFVPESLAESVLTLALPGRADFPGQDARDLTRAGPSLP